jgi:hypothetical protein
MARAGLQRNAGQSSQEINIANQLWRSQCSKKVAATRIFPMCACRGQCRNAIAVARAGSSEHLTGALNCLLSGCQAQQSNIWCA